jgi:hypothetical protein
MGYNDFQVSILMKSSHNTHALMFEEGTVVCFCVLNCVRVYFKRVFSFKKYKIDIILVFFWCINVKNKNNFKKSYCDAFLNKKHF